MKNMDSSQTLYPIWTRETIAFIMADLKWKANELETRLKSPYPLLFVSPTQPENIKPIEIQPLPDKS
jgi:hypothetical protein